MADIQAKINAFLIKLNTKQKYGVFIGLLVFIFIIDYFILLKPQLNKLSSLNPEIQTHQSNIERANNDMKRLNQYRVQVKELKEDIVVENKKIKMREEIPIILERISQLANRNGVKIDQIIPYNFDQEVILENNDKRYISLPIFIEARSGYHDFGRFLSQLEMDDVHLNVDSFDISASDTSRDHAIKLTLTAIVFEKKS